MYHDLHYGIAFRTLGVVGGMGAGNGERVEDHPVRPTSGDRKAFTRAERDAFFTAAASAPPPALALLRVLYETASRVTEALHLRWEDVDLKSGTIRVVRLKGSKTKTLDVGSKLVATLKALPKRSELVFPGDASCAPDPTRKGKVKPRKAGCVWEHCPGGHILRQQVNRWIEEFGKKAGIVPGLRHPHVLKHTRCCDEARANKHLGPAGMIAAVRQLTGHATDSALLIYLDEPEAIVEKTKKTKAALDEVP